MIEIKRLLSVIAICALSFFCSSCAPKHATVSPELRVQFLNDLKEGRLSLNCQFECDWSWLQNYHRMVNLHNSKMWEELTELVMQVGLENGVSYYFLGKAADELGYYDAAIKYYKYSIALYNDPRAMNHCDPGERGDYCGVVDSNYEIPLLIAEVEKKKDSLNKPVAGFPSVPEDTKPAVKSDCKTQDPAVKSAQKQLSELGYDTGGTDGLMGKMTKDAIRKYQHDNNLSITGKLDKETRAKLNNREKKEESTGSVEQNSTIPAEQIAPLVKEENIEEVGKTETKKQITEDKKQLKKDSPALSIASPGQSAQSDKARGIVTESTNVLNKPSIMGDAIGNLSPGTTVDILEKQEKFYKIKYQDKEGYIYSDFVKEI